LFCYPGVTVILQHRARVVFAGCPLDPEDHLRADSYRNGDRHPPRRRHWA
jgi:hypothetical protein